MTFGVVLFFSTRGLFFSLVLQNSTVFVVFIALYVRAYFHYVKYLVCLCLSSTSEFCQRYQLIAVKI